MLDLLPPGCRPIATLAIAQKKWLIDVPSGHRRHGWAWRQRRLLTRVPLIGAATVRSGFPGTRDRVGENGVLKPSSPPSTGTCAGRRDGPSNAHWPSSVSPPIPRSDMRRNVSGFVSASRIQQRSGGTSSSWSPLTGESPASWVAGGNKGNRNDSCQAPFGVGDSAVPKGA